jgi:hypothetical protein
MPADRQTGADYEPVLVRVVAMPGRKGQQGGQQRQLQMGADDLADMTLA